MHTLRQASEFKGSNGFGGFYGLLGTGVKPVVCEPSAVPFLLFKNKKIAMLRGGRLFLREYQIIREIRRIRLNV
jgi:hypothetical protein